MLAKPNDDNPISDDGRLGSPVVTGARDISYVLPEVKDLSQWPLHHLAHHPLLHVHQHSLHNSHKVFILL